MGDFLGELHNLVRTEVETRVAGVAQSLAAKAKAAGQEQIGSDASKQLTG